MLYNKGDYKMVKKGDWVRIHKIILTPEERAPQVPEDTKSVPLELWVKGFALTDGEMGSQMEVETVTGRKEVGTVVAINPRFDHDFGKFVPELGAIDKQVRGILFGGDK